jgi:hypothetical protein
MAVALNNGPRDNGDSVMVFAPKQSKANQIWLATFALVILALAIETQPHSKAPTKAIQQPAAPQGTAHATGVQQ